MRFSDHYEARAMPTQHGISISVLTAVMVRLSSHTVIQLAFVLNAVNRNGETVEHGWDCIKCQTE